MDTSKIVRSRSEFSQNQLSKLRTITKFILPTRVKLILSVQYLILIFITLTVLIVSVNAQDNPVNATLQVKKEKPHVRLTFTLTNNTEETVKVLKWFTPFEGIRGNIFLVQLDNKTVTYRGRLVKRGDPRPEDFLVIEAGQSISTVVDLSSAYDLTNKGTYSVEYKSPKHSIILRKGQKQPTTRSALGRINIPSNKVTFQITNLEAATIEKPSTRATALAKSKAKISTKSTGGRGLLVRTLISNGDGTWQGKEQYIGWGMGVLRYPAQIGDINNDNQDDLVFTLKEWRYNYFYEGCSKTERETIDTAGGLAASTSDNSINHLRSNPTGDAHYTEWFGTFNSSRHSEVKSNFSKIYNAAFQKSVTFVCHSSECASNDYAFVYAGGDIEIFLCPLFWSAPTSGFDTQFGTIVHELSHEVADTDDIVYGTTDARDLATNDPSDAIKNADNHEYFEEDLP
jgi:peptidyl-Lys metalloendopeptidase